MELTLFEICRKKKIKRWFALCLFGISAFYAAVCTPLFHFLNSDILLVDTVFPFLLDILMQFLNYLFYWSAFAFVLYTVFRFGMKNSLSFLLIYASAVFFRYFTNLLAGYLMTAFPQGRYFVSNDLPELLIYILLDLILIGILYWILHTANKKYRIYSKKHREQFVSSGFPCVKLFDLKNPIQKNILYASIIPAVVQLISRVIYDINYGAPNGLIDLLWMVVYYLSDLACVLIGYMLMLMLINRISFSEEKAKLEDEPILPNIN